MTTSPLPSAPAAVVATRAELRDIAAQAELTARLDALLTQEQADAGVRPEERGKGVGNVVAAGCCRRCTSSTCSPAEAGRLPDSRP